MADKKLNQQFKITGTLSDLYDSTDIDISNMISSVAVKKDFNTDIMPLFVVYLKTDYDLHERIRKHEVQLALNIEEFDVEEDIDDLVMYEPASSVITFSGMLKIFDKNIQELDIKQDNDNPEVNQVESTQFYNITLSCIPEKIYNQNSKIINAVYGNATLTEIVVDILDTEQNKVYIDRSDNTNREETLLIPPLNVSNAIQYLHQNYGLYNSSYKLFFDFERIYLIKTFNDKADAHKLIVNVVSQNEISDSSIYNNIILNDDGNLVKTLPTHPIIVSHEDVTSNLLGGNAIIGSYGEDYELITRSYNNDPNETKVRYYWNPGRSERFETMHNTVPKQYSTIVLENVSPNYIDILTKVEINSAKTEINGSFDIQSIRQVFGTSDYKLYSGTTLISIAK